MPENQTTLEPGDAVKATIVAFVGAGGEGPGGVHVIVQDAYGNKHDLVLKRKMVTEIRPDA